MPTYDFVCNNCNQRFDVILTFAEYGKKTVTCTHCTSKDARRRMTKIRIAKSEEARMDSMADERQYKISKAAEPGRLHLMAESISEKLNINSSFVYFSTVA